MSEYRRFQHPGATWFFTVNLAERKNNRLLVDRVDELKNGLKRRHPFDIDAAVILPGHLHSTVWMQEVRQRREQLPSIWTLPEGDSDFSSRWGLINS